MGSRWPALLSGILVSAVALAIAACGGDDDESATSGNEVDRAFVAGMVPHHELAIEMARVAQQRAESQFVRDLAGDIVAAQRNEITDMRRVDAKLAEEGVEIGDLGVPGHETGTEGSASELRSAQPFDRQFIDMMVPHHSGAITQARVELAEGENAELVTLAQEIIDAQSREIRAMNEHRTAEFGAPSPAGGLPPAAADEGGDEGH
jgi:uncharacterized protein (DUF305 family)